MRILKFVMFLSLLVLPMVAEAYDVIFKTDGTSIRSKVLEMSKTEVKYKRYSNLSGPTYTIPVAEVESILYENGERDVFRQPSATPEGAGNDMPQKTVPAPSVSSYSSSENDAQLLSRYYNESMLNVPEPDDYRKKAKMYRIIGWGGGSALVLGGVVAACVLSSDLEMDDGPKVAIVGGLVAAGAGVCAGFNIAANNMVKKARELEMRSGSLIQQDILTWGRGSSLTASLDMVKSGNTYGPGLGVKLSF